jgi:hypothetical protein
MNGGLTLIDLTVMDILCQWLWISVIMPHGA